MDYWKCKLINLIDIGKLNVDELESVLGYVSCQAFQAYKDWYVEALIDEEDEELVPKEDKVLQAMCELGCYLNLEKRIIYLLHEFDPDSLYEELHVHELDGESEKALFLRSTLFANNLEWVKANEDLPLQELFDRAAIEVSKDNPDTESE